MLLQQTIDKLYRMKLFAMAQALSEQSDNMTSLSFEERLGLMVDREWDLRESRGLNRRLQVAKLKLPATVEDIYFTYERGLDKASFLSLAECNFIKLHRNVIVTGATGTGKTYAICALANKACRLGYSARYFRTSRLLSAIALARADGTYPDVMRKLEKAHLLVLDDWGLYPFDRDSASDLFELLDDRSHRGSVIIASQIPVSGWHETIACPTMADSILDRLVHNAYRIEMKGESMRKKLSEEGAEKTLQKLPQEG